MIRALYQLLTELVEKVLDTVTLNRLKRHPVNTRSTFVGFYQPIGFLERLLFAHVDIQSSEAPRRFSLRLDV